MGVGNLCWFSIYTPFDGFSGSSITLNLVESIEIWYTLYFSNECLSIRKIHVIYYTENYPLYQRIRALAVKCVFLE